MAKIYLSATYTDLKACRDAVYRILRILRHDVISMEDYVATDAYPLHQCLADVAACDLYVGLVGWRYGYIPEQDNPERKSITELEYRQAGSAGKPRSALTATNATTAAASPRGPLPATLSTSALSSYWVCGWLVRPTFLPPFNGAASS